MLVWRNRLYNIKRPRLQTSLRSGVGAFIFQQFGVQRLVRVEATLIASGDACAPVVKKLK